MQCRALESNQITSNFAGGLPFSLRSYAFYVDICRVSLSYVRLRNLPSTTVIILTTTIHDPCRNKPHQLTSHDDEKEEELVPIVVKSEASDNPNNGQTAQQPTLPKSPRSPTTSAPSYHSTFSTGFIQGSFLRIIALDPPTLLANRETLRACTEMGTIIVWFYLADRTPVIAAGPKEYIRDVFLSIFAVLTLVAGNYTMKKGRAPVLINRQQTEEWKGWMQVLFLLYHYYEAREVYNAIRIFIASYVWMTGFGNFAYYYKTRDFSMGRFCQMMWRLNLLAVLCCAALNNEYMLYYICPMHTLYTIMVYAALGLWKKGNDSTIGLAVKIILSFVVVIVVWEIKEVFYIIWRPFLFFLGYTDPRRPNPDAMHGMLLVVEVVCGSRRTI